MREKSHNTKRTSKALTKTPVARTNLMDSSLLCPNMVKTVRVPYLAKLTDTCTCNRRMWKRRSLTILTICNDIHSSTGTVASKKMRTLDFLVKIEAAQLLQMFAQNYFKDFYEMGGERDDNSILQRMKCG